MKAPGGVLAAAIKSSRKTKGQTCTVARVLNLLATTDPALRAELATAITDPTTKASELSRATYLLAQGESAMPVGIAEGTITRHRRDGCGCSR